MRSSDIANASPTLHTILLDRIGLVAVIRVTRAMVSVTVIIFAMVAVIIIVLVVVTVGAG